MPGLQKKDGCQLQAKVCAQITGLKLNQACLGKSVVRWTVHPDMTIAVDWDVKPQTPQRSKGGQFDWLHLNSLQIIDPDKEILWV